MICPLCTHDLFAHDGDGYDAPYECTVCACVWEIGLDGRPERLTDPDRA